MSDDDLFDAVTSDGDDAPRRTEPAAKATDVTDDDPRPRESFENEVETPEDESAPAVVDATPPAAKPSAPPPEAVEEASAERVEVAAGTTLARPEQPLPHAGSLGASLAELRRRSGLTLAQVSAKTRIKEHYLAALEADDLGALPTLIYVIAFVKRLCALYGVSAADAETLVAGMHDQVDYEIPEDMTKSVICREQDLNNRRRLRNLTIALIAGAVLILALLILGGAVLVLRLRNGGGGTSPETVSEPAVAAPTQVDESMLRSFHERPQLNVTRIPPAK